jgi:hypothetical protein
LTAVAANDRVRTAFRALLLVAALVGVLAVAAPAGAAKSCGRAVIDDWYEDGRVDGTYALHCYDDAIENLPRDVRDYSSAKEDIQRALQARKRGEDAPPASTDPTPGGSAGAGGGSGASGGSGTPGAETLPTDTTGANGGEEGGAGGGGGEASGPTDPESASSIPIPLLILAGLALLLIACGSAGYLIRRLQARRPPPSAV